MDALEVSDFIEFEEKKTYFEQLGRFYEAELNAFAQAGIPYGEVSFACPACEGEAISIRLSTPDHPAYSITILGNCKDCGIRHTSGVRYRDYK